MLLIPILFTSANTSLCLFCTNLWLLWSCFKRFSLASASSGSLCCSLSPVFHCQSLHWTSAHCILHSSSSLNCIAQSAVTHPFYSSLQFLTHTSSPQPLFFQFSSASCTTSVFIYTQVSTLSFFLAYPLFLWDLIYLKGFSPSLYILVASKLMCTALTCFLIHDLYF